VQTLPDAAGTAALLPPRRPRSPYAIPVTLLSPLTPMKKGANALYIGVLSPLHPLHKNSYDQFWFNRVQPCLTPIGH
jgi:hypothetical protein